MDLQRSTLGTLAVEGCAHCALRGFNLRSARVTVLRW